MGESSFRLDPLPNAPYIPILDQAPAPSGRTRSRRAVQRRVVSLANRCLAVLRALFRGSLTGALADSPEGGNRRKWEEARPMEREV